MGKQLQETRVGQLAAFFHTRPGIWIDGRTIGTVAGVYAWRTRISDLRRPPFSMSIINRQRTVQTPTGSHTVSEYRFVRDSPHQDRDVPLFDRIGA